MRCRDSPPRQDSPTVHLTKASRLQRPVSAAVGPHAEDRVKQPARKLGERYGHELTNSRRNRREQQVFSLEHSKTRRVIRTDRNRLSGKLGLMGGSCSVLTWHLRDFSGSDRKWCWPHLYPLRPHGYATCRTSCSEPVRLSCDEG